jgi:hypothetical protein
MKREKIYRIIAFYLAINIIGEICFPTVAMALTSGPAQPENSSFEPVSTSEMVDLFSGDFTYNIPLLDVEGYPINISYQSNITMDQEASWVGLGWNINPGTINRNMRGIPDDFKGDAIQKELNMKPNRTYGVSLGKGREITGFSGKGKISKNASFGINYNNYTGISFELAATVGLASSNPAKMPLTGSLGFSSGANGLTISPRIGFASRIAKSEDWTGSASIGTSFNSRSGLKELTLQASVKRNVEEVTTETGEVTGLKGGFERDYSVPISFGKPTYIPQINMPMKNIAVSLSFKWGTDATAADRHKIVSGFFSQQKLAETETTNKAYGYLNLQDARGTNASLDFNREKDGPFDIHTSTLPLANLTYDMYNVSGQGIGGSFRPYRNDIGFVYDHDNYSNSDSYSIGAEIASGNIVKGGVDYSQTDVNSTSGKWTDFNAAKNYLKYRKVNEVPGFEPSFFKQAGELNVDVDASLYNNIRTEELVRLRLKKHSKFKYELTTQLEDNNGNVSELSSGNFRNERQNRNQYLSYIPRSEYANAAVSKNLAALPSSDPHCLYSLAPSHHIAELTAVKPDGTRYIYGVASYNTKHREVSFNASDRTVNATTGLVTYIPGDNSKSNKLGQDNFFSAIEIPAYAHSYLLTSVLSPDFVDLTGDGPTPDDLGTYTNLTYKRTTDSYKWRVPYEANSANYNEGGKALTYDDQGNYLYGEKEIRFLEKIETKNYIAIFQTVPRRDGHEAAGENGGLGTNSMHLLKKISLYTKPEYAKYLANPSTYSPDPIKEVHFVYDYSLCQDATTKVPNNDASTSISTAETEYLLADQNGKLTLKKIYFTYSNSLKAKLSPYQFSYNIDNSNPAYNMKGYDRWGMYKSNTANPASIQNSDYPYSDQNPVSAKLNSGAWSLERIILPSGGDIKVEYEPDDYAYVQDKVAGQMFSLTNIGQDPTTNEDPGFTPNNTVFSSLDKDYNVLYFKLATPIPMINAAQDRADFYRMYLRDIKYLYFRSLMRTVRDQFIPQSQFEYVSGYSEIADYGLSSQTQTSGSYEYGWVRLKNVCRGDNKDGSNCFKANPISKAAWLYARIHNPREALSFNNDPDPNLDPEDIIFGLVDIVANVMKVFKGVNKSLEDAGIGKEIIPARSWIRLNTPNKIKLGGGSRVKVLRLNDAWYNGAGGMFDPSSAVAPGNYQTTSDYGQMYFYTTIDPETGKVMSSGVAQNEPSVGGDESPLKLPFAPRNADKQEKLLAPDDFQYQEEPIGESLYPNASVGYSKVTVKNLPYSNVNRHATGKEVFEYYTARDFPIISQKSEMDPRRGKSVLGQVLKFDVKDYMTATQGFRVILNDMHGKLKSHFVYQEDKAEPISGQEYFYKTNATGNQLENSVKVINKNGTIESKNVGVDFDFVADFRQQETETTVGGVQINVYSFAVGPIPAIIPPVLPTHQRERTRFRSSTVTKVINKYGLLDKTVVYDLGSKATTEYLAYDAITGDVLLTRTNTAFDDNIYNIKYPSHFAYEGMSSAFKGTGATIPNTNSFVDGTGKMNNTSSYYQFVYPGDVYIRKNGSSQSVAYAHKIGNFIYLVGQNGAAITSMTTNDTLKIYRSGRRNMQMVPIEGITSFYNPLDGNKDNVIDVNIPYIDQSFGIIQSTASEFSNQWKTFCECGIAPGDQKNPYLIGTLGNWRKKKDYAFLTIREQTKTNSNSNVRKDGTFKEYSPFWVPAGGNDWNKPTDLNSSSPKWTWVNEATLYSTNGLEIENKDALGRYSSAYLGYNYTLASAVVANSKYKQSGFDGFEDYDFRTCDDDHLGFKSHKAKVSTEESHSGKKSMKKSPTQTIQVNKIIDPCQ